MEIYPVTINRWNDLVQLFENNGNPNYCWCMTWRMSNSEFRSCNSNERKKKLKQKVRDDIPIGILGYIHEKPVGWCSVAPRETYSRLERSRSIPKIDNKKAWSITCFFIEPNYQLQNLTLDLLKGATDYAYSEGAEVLEGYPIEPKVENGNLNYKVNYRFMGFLSTFLKAGFQNVTPDDSSRIVMRYKFDR